MSTAIPNISVHTADGDYIHVRIDEVAAMKREECLLDMRSGQQYRIASDSMPFVVESVMEYWQESK